MPLTRWPPDSERAHEPLSEQWGGNARDLHTHKQSGLMEQEDGRFAFLTSAGVGGLAAVIAAVIAAGIAYHGLRTRLDGDRGLARDAQVTAVAAAQEVDARQRWWEVLQWVWANKDPLNTADPLIAQRVLEALEGLAVGKPRRSSAPRSAWPSSRKRTSQRPRRREREMDEAVGPTQLSGAEGRVAESLQKEHGLTREEAVRFARSMAATLGGESAPESARSAGSRPDDEDAALIHDTPLSPDGHTVAADVVDADADPGEGLAGAAARAASLPNAL